MTEPSMCGGEGGDGVTGVHGTRHVTGTFSGFRAGYVTHRRLSNYFDNIVSFSEHAVVARYRVKKRRPAPSSDRSTCDVQAAAVD